MLKKGGKGEAKGFNFFLATVIGIFGAILALWVIIFNKNTYSKKLYFFFHFLIG